MDNKVKTDKSLSHLNKVVEIIKLFNDNIKQSINNNDISCYIQRGILSELKKIIIKLECEKNYDKLNYNFAKILIKKER